MKRFVRLLVVGVVLFAVGCSSTNPSREPEGSTKDKGISAPTDAKSPESEAKSHEPKVTGPGDWHYIGTQESLYRGTILNLNTNSGELRSLTLDVAESIYMEGQHAGNFGPVDDLSIEVVFEESVSEAGQLESRLKKGGEIVVVVGQYVKPPGDKSFRGAKFDRTYYRVDDKYYNLYGDEVDIHKARRAVRGK